MLTVRDLLGGLDVRLAAGEGGLDLPVRWVHITELLDPTPWLSGGEILLTTGLLLDDEQQQRDFVARLADHQLAGLGFGTGFTHDSVPEPLLEIARERDFPVFEVPYELPFIAVTEAAFTRLVNEQYAVLRRALAAQERLERIVLSERGLDAVAGALATLLGAGIVVFDPRGLPLVHHAFRRPIDERTLVTLATALRERGRESRAFMPTVEDAGRVLALPVAAEGTPRDAGGASARVPEAWLVALKDSGPLTDFDRLTLHQAVTIVALELLRSRVADDTERRLAGDILAAVVAGELPAPSSPAGSDRSGSMTPWRRSCSAARTPAACRPTRPRSRCRSRSARRLMPVLSPPSAPRRAHSLPASGRMSSSRSPRVVGARVAEELGVRSGIGAGRSVSRRRGAAKLS